MGERHDYIALEWVAGDVEETLSLAAQVLGEYVADRDNVNKLRSCLSAIHQVQGTLKMVEFFGAALLAEEMEGVTNAILLGNIHDSHVDDALVALKQSLDQLPLYLEHIKEAHHGLPAALLPLLNDLRAVRGESLLSETVLFSPDLRQPTEVDIGQLAVTGSELEAVTHKLRQMFQIALLGLIRGRELPKNLNFLAKVCARLLKLSTGCPSQPLWRVCIAVLEGLLNGSIEASVAVKILLRQVDQEIKLIIDNGEEALRSAPNSHLLKNLLYYVARSKASSRYISEVKDTYKLDESLLGDSELDDPSLATPDAAVLQSVVEALGKELVDIKDALAVVDGDHKNVSEVIPLIRRVCDTMAILGMGKTLKLLRQPFHYLEDVVATGESIESSELQQIAAQVQKAEQALGTLQLFSRQEKPLFNDSEEAQQHLDDAFSSIVRESRANLDLAKEAIIEFVATQWNHDSLEDLPELLNSIYGSLNMVPLPEAAGVIQSCRQFVVRELLINKSVPEWQTLDTLADAITSIDYYLERLGSDAESESGAVLEVAAESVAELGYPIEPLTADKIESSIDEQPVLPDEPELVEQSDIPVLADIIEPSDDSDLHSALDEVNFDVSETDAFESYMGAVEETISDPIDVEEEQEEIDPEIIEIFVEEAEEVLEAIGESLPRWKLNAADGEAMGIVRRSFHTLKGSGNMVRALDIAALAWSVEEMLNRIVEGARVIDEQRFSLIDEVVLLVPLLVESFASGQALDKKPMDHLIACATLLTAEQSPQLTIPYASDVDQQEPVVTGDSDSALANVDSQPDAFEDFSTDTAEGSDEYDGIDLDAELLEIFAAETLGHAQVLEEFITYCADLAGPAALTDELQRALHTLKGSAKMAGVTPVAEVVIPIELLVKDLRASQLKADERVVELLEYGLAYIRAGVQQLTTKPLRPLPGIEEYAKQLDELRRERLAFAADKNAQENGIPPEALNQFLGDSLDRISDVADKVSRWQTEGNQSIDLDSLEGDISQFVDHAVSINLYVPAELGQAMGALYRRAAEVREVQEDFFTLAQRGNDELIDLLDQIAGHQEPVFNNQVLNEIQDYNFTIPQSRLGDAVEQAPDFDVDLGELGDSSIPGPIETTTRSDEASRATQHDAIDSGADEFELMDFEDALSDSVDVDDAEGDERPSAAMVDAEQVYGNLIDTLYEGDQELLDEDILDFDAAIEPPPEEESPDSELTSALEPDQPVEDYDRVVQEVMVAFVREITQLAASDDPVSGEGEFDTLEGESDLEITQADSDRIDEFAESAVNAANAESETLAAAEKASVEPDAEISTRDASESDDDFGDEITEIFLEEADELVEDIDEAIHRWEQERNSRKPLSDLLRILHTLKGGARLAGLTEVGDLSHNFETSLTGLEGKEIDVSDEFIAELHSYQDFLIAQLAAIKSGDEVQAASSLVLGPVDSRDRSMDDEVAAVQEEELEATPSPTPTVPDRVAPQSPLVDSSAAKTVTDEPIAPSAEIVPKTLDRPLETLDFEAQTKLQETVKVPAQLLEELVNLAGETSISRGRAEEQISELVFSLDEMQITVDRLQEQVRRLDMETEQQILFRQEQVESEGLEGFDPLEMDRYSQLQQLSRSLLESSSDLIDIKSTLAEKSRDMETLLIQQSRINTDLQEGLLRTRMVPFARTVPRLRRIVRQISSELNKKIDFKLNNIEGELDRVVLERMVSPLEHMLRNAVDHGIESAQQRALAGKPERGTISLNLAREGGEIVLTLSDDGGGIDLAAVKSKAIEHQLMDANAKLNDREIMQFITQSGFSTAAEITQISGRGVGLDVVHSEIKQLGGSMEIDSEFGRGTRFVVRLPFTVSVNRALMVTVGGDHYAIPLNTIEGIVRVSPFELEAYYEPDAPMFEYAGQPYQLRYMGSLLKRGEKPNLEGRAMPLPVLLVHGADHSVAIQVDSLMGSREIVVKPLGPQFSMVQGLSGATVLGDGSVVIILDLLAMIRADISQVHGDSTKDSFEQIDSDSSNLIMIVDDSVTVRKVTSRFLERHGFEVLLAKDGVDAIEILNEADRLPDLMLLDIEMPRMDGFEVANRVLHNSRLQNIPIIMITSRTGEKHRERALSLGVNDYMGKPYSEVELLEAIVLLTGATVQ